jgi:hypothetical protein
MSPLLAHAVEDARTLAATRGWRLPDEATLAEAERVLEIVGREWRAPLVQAEPNGAVTLEWDAGERGWLQLSVNGEGRIAHSAVIEGDEYAQSEAFSDGLPGWAEALLRKLLLLGH